MNIKQYKAITFTCSIGALITINSGQVLAAECANIGGVPGVFGLESAGSCEVSQTQGNFLRALGGASVQVTSTAIALVGTNNRYNNQGVISAKGAGSSLQINGNISAETPYSYNQWHGIHAWDGGMVKVDGDYSAYLRSKNARGILLQGETSKVIIDGNVDIKSDFMMGAAIQNSGILEVKGDTTILGLPNPYGDAKDGLRQGGTATFGGDFTLKQEFKSDKKTPYGGLSLSGVTTFTKNVSITTNASRGITVSAGEHIVEGDLTINTNNMNDLNSLQQGIIANGGVLKVLGASSIKTEGQESNQHGITLTETSNNVALGLNADAEILTDTANIVLGKQSTVEVNSSLANAIYLSNPGAANTIIINNEGTLIANNNDVINGSDFEKLDGRSIKVTNSGTISTPIAGKALFLGSDNDDSFTSTGGSLTGDIKMADGSDTVLIKATNIDGVALFDGGDDLTTSDAMVDQIAFEDMTVDINGDQLLNWENVSLNAGTLFNLSGTLVTGSEDDTGLKVNAEATLANRNGDVVVEGNVTNAGTIDLTKDGAPSQALTITGDYAGQDGARLLMNTVWNLSDSSSDKLIIEGKASGTTSVVPTFTDAGGNVKENVISGDFNLTDETDYFAFNTVPAIVVKKTENSTPTDDTLVESNFPFKGDARVNDSGLQAYLATRINDDGEREYFWTTALKIPPVPNIPVVPTPIPNYNAATSGYVQMPMANLEMGYLSLSGLHERRGENQTMAWDACGCIQKNAIGQTWARLYGQSLDLVGKQRFDTELQQFGVQIGHDFSIKYNSDNGSRRHTGAYLDYQLGNIDFFDNYRAPYGVISVDKYTGKGKSQHANLGLYSTYYKADGSYLDLVGQAGYVHNTYQVRGSDDKLTQNGISVGLSAEVGKPYVINNTLWTIEPQAQLMYQYLDLSKFNDTVSIIKQEAQNSLRGRLGFRLSHNQDYQKLTRSLYLTANVYHDFIKLNAVKVGKSTVEEKYNRTYGEVGLGLQLPVSARGYIYTDVRYERNLGGAKRQGYKGNIGYKYTW